MENIDAIELKTEEKFGKLNDLPVFEVLEKFCYIETEIYENLKYALKAKMENKNE